MAKTRTGKNTEKLKDRPESVISVITAGIQFVLMVFGIIGLATLIFAKDGLLPALGSKLMQADSFASLLAIPLALVALYLGRVWFERTFGKSSSAVTGDLAMYVMMAIGAFFVFRFLSTGAFTG